MAWSDKPTPAQLGAFANLIKWKTSQKEEDAMVEHLEKTADRKQMSDELSRVRTLYLAHSLNRENLIASEIWEGFQLDEEG